MKSKKRVLFAFAVAALAAVAALPAAAGGVPPVASADEALNPAEAQARAAWRANIEQIETPREGCFHASYPNLSWEEVACHYGQPPVHPVPRTVKGPNGEVVGNGHDYAAGVKGLISKTVGSFPTVLGVKTEESAGGVGGILGPNEYSLQLNSNFGAATAACNGSNTGYCLVWQQFIYATDLYSYPELGEAGVFMQYWLIDYGDTCPTPEWYSVPPDCVNDSAIVPVPDLLITDLARERISASAVADGNDTVVFTYDRDSYAVSAPDTVVDLATVWDEAEFNVFGNGGGSEAVFNWNSSIVVNVAVSSGSRAAPSRAAPSCLKNAGTAGETNNLNLGPCIALGGTIPAITFLEANLNCVSEGENPLLAGELLPEDHLVVIVKCFPTSGLIQAAGPSH